jgi:hypothetical protein
MLSQKTRKVKKASDQPKHGRIPAWIVALKLQPRAQQVYDLLSAQFAKKGVAWPSRRLMAEWLGCSVATIDRALRRLEKAGAIRVTKREGAAGEHNVYVIAYDAPFDIASLNKGVVTEPDSVENDALTESKMRPEPVIYSSAKAETFSPAKAETLSAPKGEILSAPKGAESPPPQNPESFPPGPRKGVPLKVVDKLSDPDPGILDSGLSPESRKRAPQGSRGRPGAMIKISRQNFYPSEYPDWYQVLAKIDGFTTAFAEAEAWRISKGVSQALAEAKAYSVADFWARKGHSQGDPYFCWQSWVVQEVLTPSGQKRQYPDRYEQMKEAIKSRTLTEDGLVRQRRKQDAR